MFWWGKLKQSIVHHKSQLPARMIVNSNCRSILSFLKESRWVKVGRFVDYIYASDLIRSPHIWQNWRKTQKAICPMHRLRCSMNREQWNYSYFDLPKILRPFPYSAHTSIWTWPLAVLGLWAAPLEWPSGPDWGAPALPLWSWSAGARSWSLTRPPRGCTPWPRSRTPRHGPQRPVQRERGGPSCVQICIVNSGFQFHSSPMSLLQSLSPSFPTFTWFVCKYWKSWNSATTLDGGLAGICFGAPHVVSRNFLAEIKVFQRDDE